MLIAGMFIIKKYLWNLIDTYTLDVLISSEAWLREKICNAEVFRANFRTFRRN
jgi:hypothetical protein